MKQGYNSEDRETSIDEFAAKYDEEEGIAQLKKVYEEDEAYISVLDSMGGAFDELDLENPIERSLIWLTRRLNQQEKQIKCLANMIKIRDDILGIKDKKYGYLINNDSQVWKRTKKTKSKKINVSIIG